MAFLILVKGINEEIGKIFNLDKPVTIVGRRTLQNSPDIELNDEVVSRRHLEIISGDGKYWLRDLGSTNGTLLNDDRILEGNLYEIKHNARIGLGIEGSSARVILVFKESDDTNIIYPKEGIIGQSEVIKSVKWLEINNKKKEVFVDGKLKKLSKKEYELLLFLYKNAGNVCSRDQIISAVWPESKDPSAISDAAIDQLIHRLREKVEPEPNNPSRIISKKGYGYLLI